MFARVLTAVVTGIDAAIVEVQCDVAGGLPGFHIVGLPEKEVSESRERIRSAIRNSGYDFPARRITANLAPADLRKEGVGFDLPIALGILAASGQIPEISERWAVVGELGLDGEVRAVRGALPIVLAAAAAGRDGVIVPESSAGEAALVDGIDVRPVGGLTAAASFLAGTLEIPSFDGSDAGSLVDDSGSPELDLAEVKGQEMAKRALEIAAAGGHNLLMIGPPGSGKSLLARCVPGILPALRLPEALDVTRIYSIAGLVDGRRPLVARRPFRAPHHTISYAGMAGGGHGVPGPGEITLAHHGVLFLDELPEFDRRVLATLRQPLEDRTILLSRAGVSIRYPASFTLIAAMNPCPCGHLGDHVKPCSCAPHDVRRYRKRLSGPFLDRIDLFVEVPRLSAEELMARPAGEGSVPVRERVEAARGIQEERMRKPGAGLTNAVLRPSDLRLHCRLDGAARTLLQAAITRFALSGRGYARILKVARTIADLAGATEIGAEHLAEALQYRAP